MSRSVTSSRGIDRLGPPEDRLAADPVGAPLDASPAYEVHVPVEHVRKLILHADVVQEDVLLFPDAAAKSAAPFEG